MQMLSDRQLPPQSIEAEMSVLGAIFVENGCIDEVHTIIKADDFYRQAHRLIFAAMARLTDRNEPIDLITMTGILKDRGELEEIGGGAYLYVLSDYVPMAANVAHYCRIVGQKSEARRLILALDEALKLAYSGGEVAEAVAKVEQSVGGYAGAARVVTMAESCMEAVKRVERRSENRGRIQGLSYGLLDLDRATSGMHPGELIIVAGRPSMGKSALAGNIVSSACAEGKSSLFFTLEMSRDDIIDRLAAGFDIPYQNIRSGNMEYQDWDRMVKGMAKMHDWRLVIEDTPAISLREIRAKARKQKNEGLDLLAVDYLQLMSVSDPKANRVQGIGEISRGLKQLARELEIPVLLLSQLNRGVDSRPDKRPMMSDLRDSGEIEQDADVILFPYRPAAYCQKCRDKVDDCDHNLVEHQAKAELIIEKQRAGERNLSIPVCWLGQYQRFSGIYREGV
jgi:replicative DNA helicase